MIPIQSEKTINTIRVKIIEKSATSVEISEFMKYVMALEGLVTEASNEDFYGTEGWRKYIGWD